MQSLVALGRVLYELTLSYGVIGLAAGAFLESFGVPTAAAVIDLTAGILIISGRTTFVEALIVSDLGLVLGSLASYYVGRAGANVFERFHRHAPDEAERRSRARQLIERYGDKSILWGQLFGPARTWISYPAGAMKMDVKKFTLYTALGGAMYCAIVITISVYATNFVRDRFDVIIGFLTLRVFVGLGLAIALLIFLRRRLRARFSQARQFGAVETQDHPDAD